MYKLLSTLIFFTFSIFRGLASTTVPPSFFVQNYTVDDYNASCQNWDIGVSYWGTLYIANNSGLLSFDGNTWQLHRLPNRLPITNIAITNDTIYTKGKNNSGFWLYTSTGSLKYTPVEEIPEHVNFRKTTYPIPMPQEILEKNPTAITYNGSYYFIGTEKNGLYITDLEGKILNNLNQSNVLQDNIIRDVCLQDKSLIWVVCDNGISQIDINSPLTMLGKRSIVGKLLDASLVKDTLYIQTNTGYYQRTLTPGVEFEAIPEAIGKIKINPDKKEEEYSLHQLFTTPYELGEFTNAESIYRAYEKHYWLTENNQAGLVQVEDGKGSLKCRILFNNYKMHLTTNGKRIISLNDSLCIASSMQGPLLINTRTLISSGLGTLTMPKFNKIEYTNSKGTQALQPNTNKIALPHRFQEIKLNVSTTVFTPNHQISYKLEGISRDWSPWQKDGKISFLQLPTGKYELRVRKYVVKGPFPELSLQIEVLPAWYNTIWAYLVYIVIIGVTGDFLLRYYLKMQRKKEQNRQEAERLAEEKRLQQIKSELLETELQNKNNELTLQTSALVKRNQAIQSFLDELEKQKETLGDRYPNKLYNKLRSLMENALNDQADWLQFETYFNSAHQNFMDRLRHQYTDITAGDLRICCLLRMNLSTKEIASLLNISIRAVELRRYRLRKRLALDGDTNLVDFLMNF